ncbi:hypothetical protein GCM10007878_01530 [Marinospirillum insulare]|uniref:Uncharacterized protein n=1 Tax=Marinospirillum insulare TaxID=217169 RepID=A0ABQ5ZXK5_9GAMM|nr:hypothetical protein GCM10007878_01530 [Marinospirillum insulare]
MTLFGVQQFDGQLIEYTTADSQMKLLKLGLETRAQYWVGVDEYRQFSYT